MAALSRTPAPFAVNQQSGSGVRYALRPSLGKTDGDQDALEKLISPGMNEALQGIDEFGLQATRLRQTVESLTSSIELLVHQGTTALSSISALALNCERVRETATTLSDTVIEGLFRQGEGIAREPGTVDQVSEIERDVKGFKAELRECEQGYRSLLAAIAEMAALGRAIASTESEMASRINDGVSASDVVLRELQAAAVS